MVCAAALAAAAALEQSVQAEVEAKLSELTAAGLDLGGAAEELSFKSMLFRKMLDGRLGSSWSVADEQAFQARWSAGLARR